MVRPQSKRSVSSAGDSSDSVLHAKRGDDVANLAVTGAVQSEGPAQAGTLQPAQVASGPWLWVLDKPRLMAAKQSKTGMPPSRLLGRGGVSQH